MYKTRSEAHETRSGAHKAELKSERNSRRSQRVSETEFRNVDSVRSCARVFRSNCLEKCSLGLGIGCVENQLLSLLLFDSMARVI